MFERSFYFLQREVLCLLLTLLFALSASAENVEVVPNRYVIGFKENWSTNLRSRTNGIEHYNDEQLKAAIILGLGGTPEAEGELEIIEAYTALFPERGLDVDYAWHLVGLGILEFVEPDYIVHTSETTPNDSSYSSLWGLNNNSNQVVDIDAPQAWDTTTGDSDIVVGVVDTGIAWNHPDLASNMWRNTGEIEGNGIDDDGNGYIDDVYGWNGITNTGNAFDDHYHGTHCAGTIGAKGNNSEGVVGVNWNVKLMALKFLSSSGSGSTTGAIRVIDYAVSMKQRGVNIKVLNNSWGGGGYSTALYQAIERANEAGILFVAAAGNDSNNNDAVASYPANYSNANVISVAAVAQNGTLASFSNYGATTVDLGAPGVGILSTFPSGYNSISGTSMATPHVAGVAALVLSHHSDLNVVQLKDQLLGTTRPLSSLQGTTLTGGMVNANDALTGLNAPPTLEAIPDQSISHSQDTLAVTLVGADAENDPFTYSAEILLDSSSLAGLDQEHGFDGVAYTNLTSQNELWLQASATGQWFALFPNGELKRFLGDGNFEFYAQLAPEVYLAPELLYEAVAPLASAVLSLQGAVLTIDPNDGFVGSFEVRATVTDNDNRSASRTFRVTTTNAAPVVTALPDITISHSADPSEIDVLVTDSDGDSLSYTAIVVEPEGNPDAHQLAFSGSTLRITQASGFTGTFRVQVTVSDGIVSASRSFNVTVTNTPPTMSEIDDQLFARNESVRSIPVSVFDTDGDGLSLSARLSDLSVTAYQLDQSHNFYYFTSWFEDSAGHGEKWIRGDGGANWYIILPSGELYRWEGTLEESLLISTLDSSFHTTPEQLIDVAPPTANNNVTVFNGNVIVTVDNGFLGSFDVEVTASDNVTTVRQTFTVSVQNEAPSLSPLSDIFLAPQDSSREVSLVFADADGDTVSVSALLVREPGEEIGLHALDLNGATLVVTPEEDFLGSFKVEVTASDGWKSTTRRFDVNVINNPPQISELNDLSVSHTQVPVVVQVQASDQDGDALSFSASIDDARTNAFQLDSIYNFSTDSSRPQDFAGLDERWLRGSNGLDWFAVLPDGKLYLWRGSLQTSTLLHSFNADYYNKLSLLVDVAQPLAHTLVFNGSTLSISPQEGFAGLLNVTVEVSDGVETASELFALRITNNAPLLSEISDVETTEAFSKAITVSDADQDSLELSARILLGDRTPFELDSANNFYFKRSFFTNSLGLSEKWFVGNNGERFYIIMPDGRLYQWGGTLQQSTLLATIDPRYHRDPRLLFDVPEPEETPASISVTSESITVSPNENFRGFFEIEVSVTDGMDTASERFTVTVNDPEPIPDAREEAPEDSNDSDGDGVSDEDELAGGSDPFDAGSFIPSLSSPIYTLWNSFLGMTNIVELVNPNPFDKEIEVFFYSIDGQLADTRTINVPAMSQFDLILNELPGFVENSYGIVKLEFEGIIDGRVSYYRLAPSGSEYEFAFGIPLSNASYGNTAVSFNTFQPSLNPAEAAHVVANWLTIVNLDAEAQSFTIESYAQNGSELSTRVISVPGFGRMDIDGGHGMAGSSVVGLHKIHPRNRRAPYIAQLIRYGGNSDASAAPSEYSFAFPLVARAGSGRTLIAPISTQFNETNWVEITNTSPAQVTADITFVDETGATVGSSRTVLPANSQAHYQASRLLAPGRSGSVIIRASRPNSLIAQSMYYFRDSSSGSIVAMYGSQANEILGRAIFGSYNLFLGMQNWLTIGNNSSSPAQIQIIVNHSGGSTEETINLEAYGSQIVPVHNTTRFNTSAESYGTVELRSTEGSNVWGQILRLKPNGSSYDFAAPTLMR